MSKLIPSAYSALPMGSVLNGQPIKADDLSHLLTHPHGQVARFGTRHRLIGSGPAWTSVSASYTDTSSNLLAPHLREPTEGLHLWRDWTTLADLRRVGLVAWVLGLEVDLELELWAEDTDTLIATLNPIQSTTSLIWAADTVELPAADARLAGLIGNNPRQLVPKMRAKLAPGGGPLTPTARIFEVVLQEYVIQEADV